jgi:hypothetical protein
MSAQIHLYWKTVSRTITVEEKNLQGYIMEVEREQPYLEKWMKTVSFNSTTQRLEESISQVFDQAGNPVIMEIT